ncbi:MAG: TonB-dependent receptor [Gammaproteobacteria bacterium]|nr:TonB-dependent receptor [Gammaproteobacteria bacterium]
MIQRIATGTTVALLALGAAPVPAAGTRDYLDEIVVTSTRVDKDRLKVPMAISAVGQDEVQNTQQLGIDESLNRLPGVFFQNRYNFAQDLRVSIRGFGARANFGIRGIKIFTDGIPATVTDGQGGVDDIDIGSTRRIEVIRGPSSALYGSAAGGVISLFTEDGPPTPFVQLGLSAGEYDFQKYQAKAGGQTGALNWLVNSSYLNMEGYRGHSWVQHGQATGKFRYDIDESSTFTTIVSAFDSPRADDPGGLRAADVATDRKQAFCGLSAFNDSCAFQSGEAIDQQKIGFVYNKSFGAAHSIMLRNYYIWRNFESNQPFMDSGTIAFDRFFFGGGGQYTWTGQLFGHPNRVVVGFDAESQQDDRERWDNLFGVKGPLTLHQAEQADAVGVFIQNEFTITDNLELTVGGRYDRIDLTVDDSFLSNGDESGDLDFDEFSPMVGLLWSPLTQINMYFNYSTAFETPTFTELSNPAAAGTAGGFNPDLTAQKADNIEIGIKGLIGSRIGYDAAAFRIDVADEITNTVTVGSRAFFNNADTTREGVEAALTVNVFEGLDATFTYTWSDFTFDSFSLDPGAEGNNLPGIPENQFYAALAYEHRSGLYVTWDFLHVDNYYGDNANTVENSAYQVSNLRFGRPFRFDRLRVDPYFGINNMFDEEYIGNVRLNAFGGRYFEPAPKKNVYGGVTVRYEFGS